MTVDGITEGTAMANLKENPEFNENREAVETENDSFPLESSVRQWNKEKLAHLFGLEGIAEESDITGTSILTPQELFEADEDELDPHKNPTGRMLSGSPWAKGGAVGLVALAFFVGAGLFLSSVVGGGVKKAPSMAESEAESVAATEDVEETQESEIGLMKTEAAVGRQKEQMKAVAEARRPETQLKLKDPEAEQSERSPAPPERPVPPRRDSPMPPRTAPANVRAAATAFPRPSTPPPPTAQPAPDAIDPLERLATLQALGSYGGRGVGMSVSEDGETGGFEDGEMGRRGDGETGRRGDGVTGGRGDIVPRRVIRSPITSPSRQKSPRPLAESPRPWVEPTAVESEAEARILNGIPVLEFQVGMRASAQLVTPVIWAEESGEQRFVAQLSEPLRAASGEEVLAAGTELVLAAIAVRPSGWVVAEATAYRTGNAERPLLPGAIAVRGENGEALVARRLQPGAVEMAARDRQIFLYGALSRLGAILNRPEEERSTSSTFGQSTTTRNGSPNILGAVLEGGFSPLVERLAERNQQAVEELLDRPDLWYVPGGEKVQIFVNRSFEL
ncbi:TrbI/VirB10 family protein [Lusitaniella coriacea]|uniref:TrbI/VirB10 family protein n=1 Tax=Lusitaniella coriacea TaxID=1983105 RepID=UPI003CEE8CE6